MLENNFVIQEEVEKELKVKFPIDYVDFIQEFNGGEGFVGKEYFAFDHRGSEIKYIMGG